MNNLKMTWNQVKNAVMETLKACNNRVFKIKTGKNERMCYFHRDSMTEYTGYYRATSFKYTENVDFTAFTSILYPTSQIYVSVEVFDQPHNAKFKLLIDFKSMDDACLLNTLKALQVYNSYNTVYKINIDSINGLLVNYNGVIHFQYGGMTNFEELKIFDGFLTLCSSLLKKPYFEVMQGIHVFEIKQYSDLEKINMLQSLYITQIDTQNNLDDGFKPCVDCIPDVDKLANEHIAEFEGGNV